MSASAAVLTKPHFFKPLIPGFEDEFLIPVSFFKHLKGQEFRELTLRSQGGRLWPVRINGRQFENGWKQFIQDHDLHIGDFLVFRHEGDLVFDVIVFDKTTCERYYPPFIKEEIEIKEQSIPIYTSSGKKLMKKKKMQTEAKASSSILEHPYFVINLRPDSIRKNRLYIPQKFAVENGLYGRSCSIILKDKDANCWEANLLCRSTHNNATIGAGWRNFRSVHNFKAGDSLMVELIKNGERPVLKICRLQEHTGITSEPTYQNNAQAGVHLHANTKAWKYRNNQQKVPEVTKESGPGVQEHLCVTRKLMYQNNPQAGLSSFGHLDRNIEASEIRKSQLLQEVPEVVEGSGRGKWKKYKKPEAASEANASSSVTQKSFFVAKITSSFHYKSLLYIPMKFSRMHLLNKKDCKVILKDRVGRSWPAKLWHKYSDEQVYITDGWKAFCDANKLKPGDSFAFEFIESGESLVFKMCRFKANCKAGKNQEDASSVNEKPHFYVTMRLYRQMKFPRNFAWRHGIATAECSIMTIKNEMGSSWPVSLKLDKNKEVHTSSGWFEFVKGNGIEDGDVFMLELVNGGTGIRPEMQYYALKQEMDSDQKDVGVL